MPRPDTPALTVDAVIHDPRRGVALVRRRYAPFAGEWALPGGFVELGESCEAACAREAAEETALTVRVERLIGVYSTPGRDPRGPTVSVVYLCSAMSGEIRSGDDASDARWFDSLCSVRLAFDHAEILADAGFLPRPLARGTGQGGPGAGGA